MTLLVLGALAASTCKKETESLVLVSLLASPADAGLVSARITVGSEVKTFPLSAGLSASVPTTFGVYIPSATGSVSVLVNATASDGTACGGYRGTGSAPLMVGPDETASILIVLLPGTTCPADGGDAGGQTVSTGAQLSTVPTSLSAQLRTPVAFSRNGAGDRGATAARSSPVLTERRLARPL